MLQTMRLQAQRYSKIVFVFLNIPIFIIFASLKIINPKNTKLWH